MKISYYIMDKLSESQSWGSVPGRICDKEFYHYSGDYVVHFGETLFIINKRLTPENDK